MSLFDMCIFMALLAIAHSYEMGIENIYKYQTNVLINEECGSETDSQPVGHSIKAEVHLTNIWQNPQKEQQKLLKMQILEPILLIPKKAFFEVRKSSLDEVRSTTSYFLLEDGTVAKFWDNPNENFVLRNLKRSVSSIFQIERKDQEIKEHDISGICDVIYSTEGNKIQKVKGNCRRTLTDSSLQQPYGPRSVTIQFASRTDCQVKDSRTNIVDKCEVIDFVRSYSNVWRKPTICLTARSELIFTEAGKDVNTFAENKLESVIQILNNSHKDTLEEGDLTAIVSKEKENSQNRLAESIKKYQDSLKTENLAKLKSSSAFYKLLPTFRLATEEDIISVLKNKKFEFILPQLLDLVAASFTESSVNAVLKVFKNTKEYDDLFERYLISLSVLPRAQEFHLQKIKALLEKGSHHEKIEATLISTLGALLKTYSLRPGHVSLQLIEDISDYLENSLKKCKSESCSLTYLRGLRNAAQPKSYDILLEYAIKGGKPALEALFALRAIQIPQIPHDRQQLLLKVFHQVGQKQDRSTRAVAAEILLRSRPEQHVLKSIMGSLSEQSDPEFTTFVASKLLHLMSVDKELRSNVLEILSEKEVAHYYALSQKGVSSLFSRQLMSADGINVPYSIELEILEGGLLKRSSFDVNLESPVSTSNLISVGMFAEGLASFAGSSSEEDGQDPTAGMELTVLGSSLRPYIFFSSTSELMGHAWSGTASESTPALQGIFLFSDDEHVVVLNNGMIVRLKLQGVLSTDLSGSIQISLWNRNSQTQVKSAGALLMKGMVSIDTDFVTTQGELTLAGQSAIDFNTNLEFYESPFQMCIKMENPDIVVKYDLNRSVEVKDSKFFLKRIKKRKRFLPGRSYVLPQRNNEQCKIMAASD